MNTYPAASVEFLRLTVQVDGDDVDDYQVAVVPWATASTAIEDWATPAVVDGVTGVMIQNLAVGVWDIWGKASDNPETPVVKLGTIEITP